MRRHAVCLQGKKNLVEPLGQMDEREATAIAKRRACGFDGIGERRRELVARPRAAPDLAAPERVPRRIAEDAVKALSRVKRFDRAKVPLANAHAIGETVQAHVARGELCHQRIELHSVDGDARFSDEKRNDARARAELKDALASFELDEAREQHGVEREACCQTILDDAPPRVLQIVEALPFFECRLPRGKGRHTPHLRLILLLDGDDVLPCRHERLVRVEQDRRRAPLRIERDDLALAFR